MSAAVRDAVALLLFFVPALISRWGFYMRGLTYRATILPLWQEKIGKATFYLGLLGVVDALLRRGGQALTLVGVPVPPASERSAGLLRVFLLHIPFILWALQGPLHPNGSTRDDHLWSDAATRSWIWRFAAKYIFKSTKIVLSEEWRELTPQQRAKWQDGRHFVVGMHPHGLLPLGSLLAGLTWAGGGLRGVTASGATLPEPENAGELLHQRWFPKLILRAAVASGAAGLFPIFYEMFTNLGAFDCTKDFIRERIREGKDVAIFPGGATESAFAHPGRYVCYISKHKGFVRIALEEQRDILPMWTFGDEAIAPQMINPPGFLVDIQQFVKSCTGLLVPPLFCGLPRAPALTVVTGVPISLEDLWAKKLGGPVSDAAVDEGHRRYIAAQQRLFDANKALVPGGHAKAVLELR